MEFKMIPYTKETKLPETFLATVLEVNKEIRPNGIAHTFKVEYTTIGQFIRDRIYLFDIEENSCLAYKGFPHIEEYDDMRSCVTIKEWCTLSNFQVESVNKLTADEIAELNKYFGNVWNKPLEEEK